MWFFHGLCRRWQDFSSIYPDFENRFALTAVDHRGHGKSDRTSGRYLVRDYVDDARQLLTRSGSPSFLIGHSLGALTALGVAAALPDQIEGIVLLDPPGIDFLANLQATTYFSLWREMGQLTGSSKIREVSETLAEIRYPSGVRLGDVRDAASIRLMARGLQDLDPQTFLPALENRWLEGFNLLELAAQAKCPVLLLVADPEKGGMMSPTDADSLMQSLKEGTRIDLPGVGHLLHWQDPQTVLKFIHSFLASF